MNRLTRILTLFLLLITFIAPCFAAEEAADGSINYFAPMMDDEAYGSLLKFVFDGGNPDEVIERYFAFETAIATAPYEAWMKEASMGRAALIVARYLKESGDKNSARDMMEIADGHIAAAREEGAPESAVGVVEALSQSFWYLVDGSLGKAMKFPGMVNDLWKKHPEDFHVLLLAADRYLHSPGIAGGNKKKGLQFFQKAEDLMEEYGAAEWDEFTIYSGLAYGYDAAKDEEKALDYALKAYGIYTSDATVNEIIDKYEN